MSGCGTHKLTQSGESLIGRKEGGAKIERQCRGRPYPSQQMANLVRKGTSIESERIRSLLTAYIETKFRIGSRAVEFLLVKAPYGAIASDRVKASPHWVIPPVFSICFCIPCLE